MACHADALQGVLSTVLKVLLHALGSNQSTGVLQNMFATQRSLVYKVSLLLEIDFKLLQSELSDILLSLFPLKQFRY